MLTLGDLGDKGLPRKGRKLVSDYAQFYYTAFVKKKKNKEKDNTFFIIAFFFLPKSS